MRTVVGSSCNGPSISDGTIEAAGHLAHHVLALIAERAMPALDLVAGGQFPDLGHDVLVPSSAQVAPNWSCPYSCRG